MSFVLDSPCLPFLIEMAPTWDTVKVSNLYFSLIGRVVVECCLLARFNTASTTAASLEARVCLVRGLLAVLLPPQHHHTLPHMSKSRCMDAYIPILPQFSFCLTVFAIIVVLLLKIFLDGLPVVRPATFSFRDLREPSAPSSSRGSNLSHMAAPPSPFDADAFSAACFSFPSSAASFSGAGVGAGPPPLVPTNHSIPQCPPLVTPLPSHLHIPSVPSLVPSSPASASQHGFSFAMPPSGSSLGPPPFGLSGFLSDQARSDPPFLRVISSSSIPSSIPSLESSFTPEWSSRSNTDEFASSAPVSPSLLLSRTSALQMPPAPLVKPSSLPDLTAIFEKGAASSMSSSTPTAQPQNQVRLN
jgi:hypothetical protein